MMIVSVVSHGQNAMVTPLISQLLACPEVGSVILTCNIPDAPDIEPRDRLHIVHNTMPAGFGANHNAAFRQARRQHADATYFCIMNPDITLGENPFPLLLAHFADAGVGLVAPRIDSPAGHIEESARNFPTRFQLGLKALGLRRRGYRADSGGLIHPDWVAGMFMLLPAITFEQLGGFDERFHLYYEDVDLCARLGQASKRIICDTRVRAIHDARRDSHRKIKYLKWHIASMRRHFLKQRLRRMESKKQAFLNRSYG
jgi:GT2 family glycosyltransferase